MAKLLETDLSTRLVRVTTAFNDVLYSSANEPSLGMYRLQEHVAVTVPRLVEQQRQLRESCQRIGDACYDLEYDARTLSDMAGITQFGRIRNDLLRAIQLKKKLDEVELRKQVSHSHLPVASLPPTHPPPPSTSSPLSLPPTLTKTTPTNQTPGDDISDSDSGDVAVESQDLATTSQDPVPDMGIRPKSFD